MTKMQSEAENYISTILNKAVPYKVEVLGLKFVINNVHTYPPGKLTAMFADFLLDNNLVKNKVVADIGSGCFALGIISAINGAEAIIGTDISEYAIECAKTNVAQYEIKQRTELFQAKGLESLLPKYISKIDVIVSGAPWDSISKDDFDKIPPGRKPISRSFYDINDELITAIMSQGFKLLSSNGRIFITSSLRSIGRIKSLCHNYKVQFKIVKEADLHNDGNTHYIIELTKPEMHYFIMGT